MSHTSSWPLTSFWVYVFVSCTFILFDPLLDAFNPYKIFTDNFMYVSLTSMFALGTLRLLQFIGVVDGKYLEVSLSTC